MYYSRCKLLGLIPIIEGMCSYIDRMNHFVGFLVTKTSGSVMLFIYFSVCIDSLQDWDSTHLLVIDFSLHKI